MTSHPSPDGISERVANLQTLLEVKRDANTRRRVHQMHSASWKALTAIRDEASRNIADEMADDDFVAALCTLVRGASEGARLIAAERARQVSEEGWTPEHDATHTNGELAQAAACYTWPNQRPLAVKQAWPWDRAWWKPASPARAPVACGCRSVGECEHASEPTPAAIREARVKDLARAGALIAAEIDRLTLAARTPN